jgi:hypothetical protein
VGFFLSRPSESNVNSTQIAYMLFLKHVFDECRKELEKHFLNSTKTHAALSTSWRDHLETDGTRVKLYRSMVDASRESIRQWKETQMTGKFEVRGQSSQRCITRI